MKILGGKRCRTVVLFTLLVFIGGVIYFGYFCPDQVCALSTGSPTPQYKTAYEAYLKGELPHQDFAESQLDRDYNFNIEGNDVIVYLHMQKTGGTTFGRHLVKNIQLSKPCVCHRGRKKCDCTNSQENIWLFSRYSTGWACGLHADWTELQNCVNEVLDKRERTKRKRRYRYLYITILRDPVMRYLSEWKHVQRGSTWLAARLRCDGRSASLEEVPFCFTGEDWSDVTLEEFAGCPHNLANNRLTRMLSNLSLVGCYNFSAMPPSQRDQIMLQSAKENLRSLAFFGLTEYQRATQYMFERTFQLEFIKDFTQRNVTHAGEAKLTSTQRESVLRVNRLDIELYQYAKDLFLQRLQHMQEEDTRKNITSKLLSPTGSPQNHDLNQPPPEGAAVADGVKRKSTKKRRKSRGRHKYRTRAEIEEGEEEREDGARMPGVGGREGMLVPLNGAAVATQQEEAGGQLPQDKVQRQYGADLRPLSSLLRDSDGHPEQRQGPDTA